MQYKLKTIYTMANKISDRMVEALRKRSMVEDLLQDQMESWIKTLPPLPPGWVYDFIPGEPKYNPETKAWEATMEAKPRQKYIIKED